MATSAIKTAGSLLLVLGLIICLFYFLKKIRFGSASAQGAARMRLISTLSLAPKRSVALIEIRDQWLVVGIGTESVTLLSQINRPEEEAGASSNGTPTARGFGSLLKSKIGHAGSENEKQ